MDKQNQAVDSCSNRLENNLEKNVKAIKSKLKNDKYLVVGKVFNFYGEYTIIYMEKMADKDWINRYIIAALRKIERRHRHLSDISTSNWVETISRYVINSVNVKKSRLKSDIVTEIIKGNTCIFYNNSDKALVIGTRKVDKRSVEKTQTEVTVLGSKEAFTEDLATNIVLIKRRYKTDKLKFSNYVLGQLSNTDVTICWIQDTASQQLVDEISRRVSKIDVDIIYDVSMIIQLIEDNPLSIWSQHVLTERPDIVSNHLAEGKIAILCDNSPFALIVPVSLFYNLMSPDDYYERPIVGTFFRLLRYIGIIISIYLSPLYLAFTTHNHAIVPPDLAITISDGRVGVPFPSFVELLLMTFIIDLLREAGIRLPRAMGSAIGILGAVVIGQAAVSAGYVSASLVIIISITAIANFAIPSNLMFNSIRIVNYLMIVAAGIFGIFGIHFFSILVLWQLVRHKTYGISILAPVVPGKTSALKDIFVRAPIGKLRKNMKKN